MFLQFEEKLDAYPTYYIKISTKNPLPYFIMDSSFWKAGAVKENRKNRTSDKSFFAADAFWKLTMVGPCKTEALRFCFTCSLYPRDRRGCFVFDCWFLVGFVVVGGSGSLRIRFRLVEKVRRLSFPHPSFSIPSPFLTLTSPFLFVSFSVSV